ncbi:MAG: hypothetical protein AB7T37_02520 [Dehalococcoidia bacterium]
MACQHPPEERKAVFAGGANALRDRSYCALCGEVLVIEAVAQVPAVVAMRRGA